MAGLAAAAWLPLTYSVPASLPLSRARDSVLGGVNGSWLLWIVATQSLSIAAAILVPAWPSQSALRAPVADGLPAKRSDRVSGITLESNRVSGITVESNHWSATSAELAEAGQRCCYFMQTQKRS